MLTKKFFLFVLVITSLTIGACAPKVVRDADAQAEEIRNNATATAIVAQAMQDAGQTVPAEVSAQINTPAAQAPACREGNWLENAKSATTDVAALVSLLDRDFTLDQGGQWSEPGFTVPAGSVFWTDLFDNAKALPKGVAPVRTQGGWGVYVTSVDYVVPADNGGGRFLRLCK